MHTPGEWRIIRGGVFPDALGLAIHSEEGKVIAAGVKPHNAPLIAAAPELLRVCKAANLILNMNNSFEGKQMRKALKAAILKAEE